MKPISCDRQIYLWKFAFIFTEWIKDDATSSLHRCFRLVDGLLLTHLLPCFIYFYFLSYTRITTLSLSRLYNVDECGATGGMKIGRGNRSIRTKPALGPLPPSQIPLSLVCNRTRAPRSGKPANNRLSSTSLHLQNCIICRSACSWTSSGEFSE
jgi:hypothetical protein